MQSFTVSRSQASVQFPTRTQVAAAAPSTSNTTPQLRPSAQTAAVLFASPAAQVSSREQGALTSVAYVAIPQPKFPTQHHAAAAALQQHPSRATLPVQSTRMQASWNSADDDVPASPVAVVHHAAAAPPTPAEAFVQVAAASASNQTTNTVIPEQQHAVIETKTSKKTGKRKKQGERHASTASLTVTAPDVGSSGIARTSQQSRGSCTQRIYEQVCCVQIIVSALGSMGATALSACK